MITIDKKVVIILTLKIPMPFLQELTRRISVFAKDFISFIRGFLNTAIILAESAERESWWKFFSLRNFILVILVTYFLDWILAILRYIARVFLKVFRWVLFFCIVAKIILDIASGRASSEYNFKNFRQSVSTTINEITELFSSGFKRRGKID